MQDAQIRADKGPWKPELHKLLKQLKNYLGAYLQHPSLSSRQVLGQHMLQEFEGGIEVLMPLGVLREDFLVDASGDWIAEAVQIDSRI